jgi:hypothetical protein
LGQSSVKRSRACVASLAAVFFPAKQKVEIQKSEIGVSAFSFLVSNLIFAAANSDWSFRGLARFLPVGKAASLGGLLLVSSFFILHSSFAAELPDSVREVQSGVTARDNVDTQRAELLVIAKTLAKTSGTPTTDALATGPVGFNGRTAALAAIGIALYHGLLSIGSFILNDLLPFLARLADAGGLYAAFRNAWLGRRAVPASSLSGTPPTGSPISPSPTETKS